MKEEEARRQKYKDQQRQEGVSCKAYKLFFEDKTPVQVAITLNLGQPEVSKLYREYCKLNRLHKLYLAYTELGDDAIGDFLKLHKLSKKEGMIESKFSSFFNNSKLIKITERSNFH